MHNKAPLISIIILSYNTKKLTQECLNTLKTSIDNLNKEVEVVVVENGTDGTGKFIEENYNWVKVIYPKENTGFAKGNNLAFKEVNKNSKYILLLNSDAIINEDSLSNSVKFMEAHPEAS